MYRIITTQTLHGKLFQAKGIVTDVLRLDLIHAAVSGNKWFKLKYALANALAEGKKGAVSFGGAYSNHLVAMAFACHDKGLQSVGIIRGEAPPVLNASLLQMKAYGMKLIFISREAYRNKSEWIKNYLSTHPDYYYIPEGGQSEEGIRGASEIMQLTEKEYTHIICAVGTGTTLAGLVNGSNGFTRIAGICSLKIPDTNGENELLSFIRRYTTGNNYRLFFDYHFGGYARKTPELINFMNNLYTEEKIPSDFVYTGKLFYAVHELIQQQYFSEGSRLLIIHSGGLQGNRSLKPGTLQYGES